MAEIDVLELTDTELRKQLKSFGQNVGPITKTTRKTLEKKLQRLIDSDVTAVVPEPQKAPRQKSTSSVGRRRSTGRVTRKSVEPILKKLAPFSSDDDDSESLATLVSVQTSPIGFPENKNPKDSQNIQLRNRRKTLPPKFNVNVNDNNTSKFNPKNICSNNDSSEKVFTNINDKHITNNDRYKYNSLADQQEKSEFSDEDFTFGNRSSVVTHSYNNSPCLQNDTRSVVKNYQKKIIIKSTKPNDINKSKIRDEIDASLLQIRNSFSAKKPSPHKPKDKRIVNSSIKLTDTEDDNDEEEELEAEFISSSIFNLKHYFQNYFNLTYLILSILLSVLIVGLYFYKEPVVLLPGITEESKASSTNLEKEANDFLDCFHNKLSETAGDADCGYINSTFVKISSLKQYAKSCFAKEKINQQVIDKAIGSIRKNNDLQKFFEIKHNAISSKYSNRRLQCRIYQAISTILFRIIMFLSVVLLGLGIYFYLKRRWISDDEETRMMMYFVDKIIDTLKRHQVVCMSDKEIPPYLPIPHVRDMLIPVAKRKTMGKTWKKAVDFLNSSESRIRVETQRVSGEDFDVWRWISVCAPQLKKEKKSISRKHLVTEQNKCWQGPAFEEIEKVVRMPIVTPTPCLKIRYMHEGVEENDSDWVTLTEDAILEKCGKDGAQILHIFVDTTSKEGCVYVKCDGFDSAGKAFRSIYGNWFDGRLVIVKFVTLARYHQRFPDALNCCEPLKPSGKSSSSLTWAKDT